MTTIRFKQAIVLTLEQKTDGNYETKRPFAQGEILTLEGLTVEASNWADLYLPRESGWVARGVDTNTFEVLP